MWSEEWERDTDVIMLLLGDLGTAAKSFRMEGSTPSVDDGGKECVYICCEPGSRIGTVRGMLSYMDAVLEGRA